MASWNWIAASRRGTAHAALGTPRQDHFRVLRAATGILVAVACDGAGSAPRGGSGAALAARLLSQRAHDWVSAAGTLPSPEHAEAWFTEARGIIAQAASCTSCPIGEFATTVVMAISKASSTLTAHVGDGAIVARLRGSGECVPLSWPDHGDYAATTFFLTDPAPRIRIGLVEGVAFDRLAVFTDGLERLSLDFSNRAAHAPFFDALFAAAGNSDMSGRNAALSRRLGTFLDSEQVCARTDDDKTLIVAGVA